MPVAHGISFGGQFCPRADLSPSPPAEAGFAVIFAGPAAEIERMYRIFSVGKGVHLTLGQFQARKVPNSEEETTEISGFLLNIHMDSAGFDPENHRKCLLCNRKS